MSIIQRFGQHFFGFVLYAPLFVKLENLKILLHIFFALSTLPSFAQQYNNWYFGNKAAISFNPIINQPIPSAILNSAMKATIADILLSSRAAASISDTAGQLLFYTNGQLVYNRNHQLMAGSIAPVADTNIRWSCIIVPHPANSNIYYIFSSLSIGLTPLIGSDPPAYSYSPYGYYYSIVDMSKDGGNGEVIVRNQLLSTLNTQRLAAVRHADGVSVWVLTNERLSNKFNAWLVTCDGLQPAPVESRVGEVLGEYLTNWRITGTMKVSPDGKQLCVVHQGDVGLKGSPDSLSFFQLFDFDNATGKISNPRTIISHDYEESAAFEYSPDSKLLYVSSYAGQPGRYFLDQYEAGLGTETAITASRVRISSCVGSDCNNQFYGMQAGPDGKIYLANVDTTLSVISRPNIKAPGCQLEFDKIGLGERNSLAELPSMINDCAYDPYNNFITQQIDSCRGIVQFNGFTAMQGPVEWYWDFGDGTTSTQQNPQHRFSPVNQLYDVKLSMRSLTDCGHIVRKTIVYPRGTYTKPDFDVITRCDSGYSRFINNSIVLPDSVAKQYHWDFGDGTTSNEQDPMHRYAASGTYSVKLKVTTPVACMSDSVIRSIDIRQPTIQAPPDQVIDAGQVVQLYVNGGGAGFSYQWSPSRWLSNAGIADPIARPMDTITYKLTATDTAGCKASDSVSLYVKNEIKGVNVPSAFTPNNDGLNDIIRPLLGSGYMLREFNIFNRWGQRVYSTSVAGEGWNGKIKNIQQPSGEYVWTLTVTDDQGNTIARKGTVLLIR